MDFFKSNAGNLALLSLLLVGVLAASVLFPSMPNVFSSVKMNNPCSPSVMNTIAASKDDLEKALKEVSMADKTVIISMVNKAYVESEEKTMLDLFMESFWSGEGTRSLVNHLLLVTVDQTAFDRCMFLRLRCYRLWIDDMDSEGEKLYMSDEFIKMMWRRTLFLADVLRRGYSFIFTDMDVIWLRNPFTRLSQDQREDLQISCDRFYGDSWSAANPINTGFYYVRSNSKTVALFEAWYAMKANSTGKKEQDVLQEMRDMGELSRLGIKVRYLDTLYFSGFCQDSRDFGAVITVHANCCRTINAKVADLWAVLHDWNRFKAFTNQTSSFQWSNRTACIQSW
ncbi:PREDICTED: uncharacterized protein At1g28695-like [Nelumbo nucifera]|nr:PREDICTED: uncharacterized protein At1g28695-like [Nelumbo nucifera]